jgi:hypothetical protein
VNQCPAGDATAMSLPDNAFSAVVCFTMLLHLPSAEAQNNLFAEALADRLTRAGFTDVSVGTSPRSNRFRARKPSIRSQ